MTTCKRVLAKLAKRNEKIFGKNIEIAMSDNTIIFDFGDASETIK